MAWIFNISYKVNRIPASFFNLGNANYFQCAFLQIHCLPPVFVAYSNAQDDAA